MKKPFFYFTFVAADFMAEVFQIPPGGHEEWLKALALDLVKCEGRTEYSKSLIAEAQAYSRMRSENGKKGGRPKTKTSGG